MKYDPIKNFMIRFVRTGRVRRTLFYKLLGVFFLREWHVKRELRRVLAHHAPGSMFDAGSGFGQYSYYCARRSPTLSILAVDVKSDQIDECRRFFAGAGISNVTFAVEDLTQSTHDNVFDLILSVDVMEHIDDDVTVFRNFLRGLRPGGRIIINTPSDQGGSDVKSAEDKSFIEEHARVGYGMAEIRSKLEAAGLTVEQARYTYGRFGSASWHLGIKIPILLVNLHKAFFLLLPFYYIITFPFTLILMALDYWWAPPVGTGLLITASKR